MGLVKGITADYCCQGVGAARLHAIKRISQPEEIANAALFLAMSNLLWVHRFTRMVGIPQSNDSGRRRIAVPAAFLYIRRPWLIRAFLHKQCEFLGNRATSDITERSSAPSSPLSSVHTEFKSRREAEISMPQRHRSMSCQSLPAGKVTNGFLSRHTRPSRQALPTRGASRRLLLHPQPSYTHQTSRKTVRYVG